jgi:hypothetical protein
LAGNLVKPLFSLYGTEWRERGYGLRTNKKLVVRERDQKYHYLAMYQLMKDREVERVRVDV